jgi:hypothetical protein
MKSSFSPGTISFTASGKVNHEIRGQMKIVILEGRSWGLRPEGSLFYCAFPEISFIPAKTWGFEDDSQRPMLAVSG